MKRAFGILGLLLAFVCSPSQLVSHDKVAAGRFIDPSFRLQPTATLIVRGLMIFHPDSERRYLDAGIPNAPEHEFRIKVTEASSDGASIFSVPIPQLGRKGMIWSLEFPNSNGKGVSFYQSEPFDRNGDVGDEKDSRWLVDLENAEFYHRQLPMKGDQASLVMRITGGEFYTKKRTLPLCASRATVSSNISVA